MCAMRGMVGVHLISSGLVWTEIVCMMHVALLKCSITQFKLAQQTTGTKVGFIYTFWYSLSSTSSTLE